MGQQLDRATLSAMQKQGILGDLEMVNTADPDTAIAAPTTPQPRLGFSPIYMQKRMELEQMLMEDLQKHIEDTSASESAGGQNKKRRKTSPSQWGSHSTSSAGNVTPTTTIYRDA